MKRKKADDRIAAHKLHFSWGGRKFFSAHRMAMKLEKESMKCSRKKYCRACAEGILWQAFKMGQSGEYE